MSVMEQIQSSLTKARNAFGAYKKLVVGDYKSLVASIADGNEPNDDDLVSRLSSAGRTADDLERDVARLVERRAARDEIAAAARSQQERARLTAERDRLAEERQAKFDAIEAEYLPQIQRLNESMLECGPDTAWNAENVLKSTADPAIDRDIKSLDGQRKELGSRIRQMEEGDNWANSRARLELAIRECRDSYGPASQREMLIARYEDQIADLDERHRQRQAKVAGLRGQVAAISSRINELEASKLVP